MGGHDKSSKSNLATDGPSDSGKTILGTVFGSCNSRKNRGPCELGCRDPGLVLWLLSSEKRREAKGKGEKERYSHLNAEFQRIARRDKKAFPSDHCKDVEENDRMGKTREVFKKIRNTQGTFHAKMGSIKDRNGVDLTEAEDIKKRWQEYTEELYKKRSSWPR